MLMGSYDLKQKKKNNTSSTSFFLAPNRTHNIYQTEHHGSYRDNFLLLLESVDSNKSRFFAIYPLMDKSSLSV